MHEATVHDDSTLEPVLPRRKFVDQSDLDITPMIDITFLLLIYFLVASVPDPNTSVALAEARFGEGISAHECITVTVVDGGLNAAPVFLADGKVEENRLSDDPEKQADQIREAVQAGLRDNKPNVLIKAEKGVAHREVARVAAAASQVDGIRLHLAVLEVE